LVGRGWRKLLINWFFISWGSSIRWRRWQGLLIHWCLGFVISMEGRGVVVTLAPGVDNVDIHEWRPVAPLHHLVAHLLQQHQGQHQRYHHHLKGEQDN
jgi:hypothetical protein